MSSNSGCSRMSRPRVGCMPVMGIVSVTVGKNMSCSIWRCWISWISWSVSLGMDVCALLLAFAAVAV